MSEMSDSLSYLVLIWLGVYSLVIYLLIQIYKKADFLEKTIGEFKKEKDSKSQSEQIAFTLEERRYYGKLLRGGQSLEKVEELIKRQYNNWPEMETALLEYIRGIHSHRTKH